MRKPKLRLSAGRGIRGWPADPTLAGHRAAWLLAPTGGRGLGKVIDLLDLLPRSHRVQVPVFGDRAVRVRLGEAIGWRRCSVTGGTRRSSERPPRRRGHPTRCSSTRRQRRLLERLRIDGHRGPEPDPGGGAVVGGVRRPRRECSRRPATRTNRSVPPSGTTTARSWSSRPMRVAMPSRARIRGCNESSERRGSQSSVYRPSRSTGSPSRRRRDLSSSNSTSKARGPRAPGGRAGLGLTGDALSLGSAPRDVRSHVSEQLLRQGFELYACEKSGGPRRVDAGEADAWRSDPRRGYNLAACRPGGSMSERLRRMTSDPT